MQIRVNGESKTVPEGCTLEALIGLLGLAGSACAAEVNKSLVPKRTRAEHRLAEGDSVELVTLVGGG
ncbi:MAG: sulfur carrier protein ThiS [Planctomycetota bacterium]